MLKKSVLLDWFLNLGVKFGVFATPRKSVFLDFMSNKLC